MNEVRSVAGPGARSRWRGLPLASLVFLLILLSLLGGFAPLVMPLGLPAGGILETGQVEPERWWLAAEVAISIFALMTWKQRRAPRLFWGAVLVAAIVLTVMVFSHFASAGQMKAAAGKGAMPRLRVGVVSALPLFWHQDKSIGDHLAGTGEAMPLSAASRHQLRAIDQVDEQGLIGLDSLLIAQPRALAPTELVALDAWIRKGGRAVVLADPLLIWPGELPLGDRRRPPLTSLLDPLLTHWGMKLEPVEKAREGLDRRLLASGHVLLTAAASRFTLLPATKDPECRLEERGLIAICLIGKGSVRLVADADLIDPRLWLVDARWAKSTAAYRSDAITLIDDWLADPYRAAIAVAPRRIVDDESVIEAMRWAIIAGLVCVGLGWTVHRRLWTE